MSNWMNEAGEPYMTAAQLRFEAELDEQSWHERQADYYMNDDYGYEPEWCRKCGEEEDENGEHECSYDEPDPIEDQWLDSYMEDFMSGGAFGD